VGVFERRVIAWAHLQTILDKLLYSNQLGNPSSSIWPTPLSVTKMPWAKPYHPPSNRHLPPDIYEDKSSIVFITIHAYNKLKPFTNDAINQMAINTLLSEQQRLRCRVYTYCLMPDHIHFLISPEIDGVSVLNYVDQFKGKTTNLSWDLGWNGKLWQPRYYDHVVRADEDLWAIGEYICENPVRNDIVTTPEDWPWSGSSTPIP
jgi:putative transposase